MENRAKEKAAELIKRYLNLDIKAPYIILENNCRLVATDMVYTTAVKCAMVAVEEIISINAAIGISNGIYLEFEEINPFWQNVKKELKLNL